MSTEESWTAVDAPTTDKLVDVEAPPETIKEEKEDDVMGANTLIMGGMAPKITMEETETSSTTSTTDSTFSNQKANPLQDLHAKVVRPALTKAGESMRQVQEKAGESMRQVQEKAGESMRQVQEKAGESLRTVQQHVGKAHEKAGQSMRQVQEKAGQSMRQVQEKAGESLRNFQQHVGHALERAGPSMRQMGEQVGQMVQQVGQVTAQKSRELSLGTQLAVAAATASTSHTLSQIGSHPLEADEETGNHKVKGEGTDGLITGLHDYGVQGLSVMGFLSALVSMILIVGHLVDFSSLLTMVLSPLVFWQKTQLKALGGMRGQQNALLEKVNTLTMENSKLTESIDTMEQQVQQLKHVEQELDELAVKAGGQVDRLVNLVHENGQLQGQIKELLDDEILQHIVTAIFTTDRDGDYTLNAMEKRRLEYRLKNLPGVTFHPDRFQAFCDTDEGDLTLADVTKIARNLQDPSIPNDQRIFEYKTKELLQAKTKELLQAKAQEATA